MKRSRTSCLDGRRGIAAGEVACTPLGLPMLWSGNFADVFKIHCPATGNTWALKCFTREVAGQRDRYRRIAAHLEQAQLPFTVDFQYLEQGIRIGGQWFPVLKMRWVEGLTLAEFVEEHLDRPGNLKMLLDLWVKLATRLREAEVAHADLQHGNVLLVPMSGGSFALRLIDYDGMYVPVAGRDAIRRGWPPGVPAPAAAPRGHVQRRGGPLLAPGDLLRDPLPDARAARLVAAVQQRRQPALPRGGFPRARGVSDLFRLLWTDFRTRTSGRWSAGLILACGRPWTRRPCWTRSFVNGEVLPLSRKEVLVCKSRLDPAPLLEEVVAERMALPPTSPPPPSPPERITTATTTPETPLVTGTAPSKGGRFSPPPRYRRFRVLGTPLWGGTCRRGPVPLTGPSAGLVGEEKNLPRGLPLLAVPSGLAAVLAEAPGWRARYLATTLRPQHPTSPTPVHGTTQASIPARKPSRQENRLRVPGRLENPDAWTGKVRFSLGFLQPRLGMRIDAATGIVHVDADRGSGRGQA